jgi:hypothetical protein
VKPAGSLHLVQLAPNLCHAVTDHSPVGFDLSFTGTAEETEAAALALKVRPASDQATGLIVEVRELDLHAPLGGHGALTENLENESRAINDLGAGLVFQVLLLDRGQSGIDDQKAGALLLGRLRNLLDLSFAEQGRGADGANAEGPRRHDVNADRLGKSRRLINPRVGRPACALARQLGYRDDRAFAPRDLDRAVPIERVQDSISPSPPCCWPMLSGCAGCKVEMACL